MSEYNPRQCAFAMGKLLERLVDEGYIREDRQSELLERARNMRDDKAFMTDVELQQVALDDEMADLLE